MEKVFIAVPDRGTLSSHVAADFSGNLCNVALVAIGKFRATRKFRYQTRPRIRTLFFPTFHGCSPFRCAPPPFPRGYGGTFANDRHG